MKRRLTIAAALAAGMLALTACGSDDDDGGSTQAASGTTGTEAAAGGDERVTIGFVAHAQGDPFIKSIIAAAQQAADDHNVELKIAGTPAIDPNAQQQRVNDVVAAGAQAVATSTAGDSMANALNGLIDDGTPVVQWNIASDRVDAPYVGEASVPAWKILGEKVLEKMGGASATGKVVLGTCAPGLGVLEARIKGIKEGMAAAGDGIEFVGPLNVGVDAVGNLNAWKQAVAANRDAKALIGVCAPDLASLGKVNADNDDQYIAGGSDLTTPNLDAIREGHAYITVGQSGYVQGYLPVMMLADAVRNGTELPAGEMVSSGVEVVTADEVSMPYGLPTLTLDELDKVQNDPATATEYYKPLFESGGELTDWPSLLEPLSNALP
jgi:ABC-type sugar transport system substrate-binding protein